MKIGDFSLHNRKVSPYFSRNELNSAFNGKSSGYFKYLWLLKHNPRTKSQKRHSPSNNYFIPCDILCDLGKR